MFDSYPEIIQIFKKCEIVKILEMIFCSCKNICGNACSCKKAGLFCSAVCKNCQAEPCSNEPKNIEEQISEEEIDIDDSDVENDL